MLLPILSLLCAWVGLVLFAGAMPGHARQLGWDKAAPRGVLALRLAGTGALGASLMLALQQDHATIAVLVWVMQLALGAVLLALLLGFRLSQD